MTNRASVLAAARGNEGLFTPAPLSRTVSEQPAKGVRRRHLSKRQLSRPTAGPGCFGFSSVWQLRQTRSQAS